MLNLSNNSYIPLNTALTKALAQAQGPNSFLFLVLAFSLQQVKAKYRSGITQAREYFPHVVMFGQ